MIELNEKIWFGKYKNKRLFEIIDQDINYFEKMIHEYNIQISKETLTYYYSSKKNKNHPPSFSYRVRYGNEIDL